MARTKGNRENVVPLIMTLPPGLLKQINKVTKDKDYNNRSEFLRECARHRIEELNKEK